MGGRRSMTDARPTMRLSSAKRREQVMTALELVGLTDRLAHRPGQLSGGQQQRVGIARAIVTDPTLIVAGRHDSATGYRGPMGLVDKYPRATLAVLSDAGHALPHEQPELLGALLTDWWSALDTTQ